METSHPIEQHIRYHREHSRGWAYTCLNISALVILGSLILGAFVDNWPSMLLFEITGALIILSSFYLLTCDFLYKRLRDRLIDEVPIVLFSCRLQDERRVGGRVLGLKGSHRFEIPGIGNDGGELLKLV